MTDSVGLSRSVGKAGIDAEPSTGNHRAGTPSADSEPCCGNIEDGMLRLDTQTGAVSYCRKKEDTWACETAEDDQSALNTEITRLLRKNLEIIQKEG